MAAPIAITTTLDPPEPLRELSVHLRRAAAQLTPLPRWLDSQPLSAMSPAARKLAWAVGRHITRNPDHGYAMAARVPASAVGSLWPLYQAAPNLESIHRAYPRFSTLLLDHLRVEIQQTERSAWLIFVRDLDITVDRAEEDFRMAMQLTTWRGLLHEPGLRALAVHFTYVRPRSTAMHEATLGTRELRFSQPQLAIEIDLRAWLAPLPTADSAEFALRLARALDLAREQQQNALEVRVESLVSQLLSSDASAQRIADLLGISVRTLHRQLKARGHSFRLLTESARKRQVELVAQTEQIHGTPVLSGKQRASLLGFSSGGALRNALQRWRRRYRTS